MTISAGACALSLSCTSVEGGGPFGAQTTFDAGDAGPGFGLSPADSGATPAPVCPFPPPDNGASCSKIDEGGDTAITCVYDPCGGESDPSPGSASAFADVCFRGTWSRIPADATFECDFTDADAGVDAADGGSDAD